jgi:hypothetical protein
LLLFKVFNSWFLPTFFLHAPLDSIQKIRRDVSGARKYQRKEYPAPNFEHFSVVCSSKAQNACVFLYFSGNFS